jgi:hypothetical protein
LNAIHYLGDIRRYTHASLLYKVPEKNVLAITHLSIQKIF